MEEQEPELTDNLYSWCSKHQPADLLKREDIILEAYRRFKASKTDQEDIEALKTLWEALQRKGMDRGLPRPTQTEPTERDLQLVCWELIIPQNKKGKSLI